MTLALSILSGVLGVFALLALLVAGAAWREFQTTQAVWHQERADMFTAATAERTAFLEAVGVERAAWRDERRELLTRIQRPELAPVAAPVAFTFPEVENDEASLAGTFDGSVPLEPEYAYGPGEGAVD